MKNKRKKGFVNPDEPLFDSRDFLRFFQDRMSQMIRIEVEAQFRDMMWK
jgi:hypothetical protein